MGGMCELVVVVVNHAWVVEERINAWRRRPLERSGGGHRDVAHKQISSLSVPVSTGGAVDQRQSIPQD